MHVQLGIPTARSISLWQDSRDGRKTRPDIFHPVYRVGILFTTSLFARVSGGIVISGRLIPPSRGRGARERGVWFEENISISVGKVAVDRGREGEGEKKDGRRRK